MEEETTGFNSEAIETSITNSWIMPNSDTSETSTTHSWIIPNSKTSDSSSTNSWIMPNSETSKTSTANSWIMANSETSETCTTHSWLMLNTNESANPRVWNADQKKIEKAETSKGIQNTTDYSNNKSDSESDGISIISENEFYQITNEDDSSMDFSDENTVDNITTWKPLELQSESLQPLCSLKRSTGKKETTNTATITEVDDENKKQYLISNNNSNRQTFKHDKYLSDLNFLDADNEDCPNIIFGEGYITCFVCTILLAIVVSCISSNTRQTSDLEKKNKENEGMRYDQFLDSLIHEYCEDISESTDDTFDDLMEKCLENLMKQFEMARKRKENNPKQKFEIVLDSKNNRFNDEHTITEGSWYMNLVQARNDIRKKDGKARWWFDRVNYRKNKRNKAYWYFQYMLNRENLRYDQRIQ